MKIGNLTERTFELMLEGARMEGTFVDGLDYSMERFYCDEFDEVKAFAKYLDEEIGGAGRANIHVLYLAFCDPENGYYHAFAENVKEKIAHLKSLVG